MPDVKRLNYFNGQFLREGDFSTEQTYHLEQQRDHARLMHTPGVAEGLEVPDPPAGASSVTVQAGVAYDDLGRRLRLSANQPVELAGFPADAAVFVTITYAEALSDVSDETGTSGSTRVTEAPVVAAATTAPGNPNRTLVLARVVRTGTTVSSVDRTSRLRSGARGGDLTANSLRLSSETIDPSNWPVLQISLPDTARVTGDLHVTGNIKPDGTVDGRDVSADGTRLDQHTAATTGAHPATAITAAAHNNIAAGSVQSQLQEIVTDLASQTGPGTGASLVGNDAFGTSPNNVAAGNVRAQLTALLGVLTNHISTGGHPASAVSVVDAGNNLNATNAEAALTEIVEALEANHFRGNETNPGQHRTIQQPALGGSKALLLDSNASGASTTRLRIYADSESVWFTLNASWNGSAWAKEVTGNHSGGLRFSRSDIEFFNEPPGAATFASFSNRRRLDMVGAVVSGFELAGVAQETGPLVMLWSNADAGATRSLYGSQTVQFRNRFPAAPSSITFTLGPTGSHNVGSLNPTAWGSTTRDGFSCYILAAIPAGSYAYWFGSYTAIA